MDCPNFETCEGELAFRVYQDGDGDPGGMYGARFWTAAELTEQTCGCEFDAKAIAKLEQAAIEAEMFSEPFMGLD
jgi:hypothetical protein